MSQQLQNFFLTIQKMPHYANQHSTGKQRVDSHEDAIADVLISNGYTEEKLQPKNIPKSKKKYKKLAKKALLAAIAIEDRAKRQAAIEALVPGMSNGTFIRQPCGGQSFPDFLVRDFSGWFVIIEAKSSGSGVPAWNDSTARPGCLYIISSADYNASTFFTGEDFMEAIVKAKIEAHKQKLDNLTAKFNKEILVDPANKRGHCLYNRFKHEQRGPSDITNPFKNEDRTQCEQNVLDFALAQ